MNIYDTVEEQRKALARMEQETVNDMVRAYRVAEAKVEDSIKVFQAKLEQARIMQIEPSPSWWYQEARLENILREIRLHLDEFAESGHATLRTGRSGAYKIGTIHAHQLAEMQVYGDVAGLPSGAYANAIFALSTDSPLKDLFDAISPTATAKAKDIFAMAMAESWGARKLGDVLGREMEHLTKDRALLIARTETIRAYRQASTQIYTANSDVMRGWRWTSAKTRATCSVCLGMDGEIFPVDKELISHPACRCMKVPLPNTDFGTPEPQLGEDYFRKLTPKEQDRIIGRGKGKLYRDGKITLKDNIGWVNNPKWGTSPSPRTTKWLTDGHARKQLPSQNGITTVSKYVPPKAESLADVLATPIPKKDPTIDALETYDARVGDRKLAKPMMPYETKAPKYRAAKVDLKTLEPELRDVDFKDVVAGDMYPRTDAVRDYIRANGSGGKTPIVVLDEGKFYLHNSDSVAVVEANIALGRTKTLFQVYDAATFPAAQATPMQEAKDALYKLGVKMIDTADVDDDETVAALRLLEERIKATGVTVDNVYLDHGGTSWKGSFAGDNITIGTKVDPAGDVAWADPETVVPYTAIGRDGKLEWAKYKANTYLASKNKLEEIDNQLIITAVNRTKVTDAKLGDEVLLHGVAKYDLFSLRAYAAGDTELAISEALVVYRRGEYRTGMLPPKTEKVFLEEAKRIIGDRKVLPELSEEEWIKRFSTGGQKGSNPGGSYLGTDGVERYIKEYDEADKAWTEHLAMRMYDAWGDAGTQTRVIVGKNGKTSIASEIVEGVKPTIADHGAVLEAYVMDAFLANWDVAGASLDNIIIDANGKARRIDAGGTWFYRAKSKSEKPLHTISILGEWETLGFDRLGQMREFMLAAGYSSTDDAAELLFDQGTKMLKTLKKIGDKNKWIDANAPGLSDAAKQKIIKMINNRESNLKDLVDQAKATMDAKKVAAKAKPKKRAAKGKAKQRKEWEAGNWVNKIESDKATTAYIKKHGQTKHDADVKRTQELLDNPDTIIMRNEKIENLLKYFNGTDPDGGAPRFKSQHETGTSQGTYDPSYRKDAEIWLFKAFDVAFGKWVKRKEDASIYGWVGSRRQLIGGYNPANQYGDVTCVIKNTERYRTTATWKDSLGRACPPAPIEDISIGFFGNSTRVVHNTYDQAEMDTFLKSGWNKSRWEYAEIQVHGQLRIDEIEEFIVTTKGAALDLEPLAKKYGIKVTIR